MRERRTTPTRLTAIARHWGRRKGAAPLSNFGTKEKCAQLRRRAFHLSPPPPPARALRRAPPPPRTRRVEDQDRPPPPSNSPNPGAKARPRDFAIFLIP